MNYSIAIKTLKQDCILSQVIEQIGECRLNKVQQTGDLLYCLSRAIIYQQLSGKAASAIHHRFLQLYDYRTYALYKLTIMCMNDIWSFQALRMKSR